MRRYLRWIIGLVDSDTLPLNVSREMLQMHGSLKTIKKKLVRKALDMIRKIADSQTEVLEADGGGWHTGPVECTAPCPQAVTILEKYIDLHTKDMHCTCAACDTKAEQCGTLRRAQTLMPGGFATQAEEEEEEKKKDKAEKDDEDAEAGASSSPLRNPAGQGLQCLQQMACWKGLLHNTKLILSHTLHPGCSQGGGAGGADGVRQAVEGVWEGHQDGHRRGQQQPQPPGQAAARVHQQEPRQAGVARDVRRPHEARPEAHLLRRRCALWPL